MRKQFNPENLDLWLDYYSDQASQVGYGITGFEGTSYHRGAGLGSFLRALFRMAVPVIKSAAASVGKQALVSGSRIAADVLQGRHPLESLEQHGREGASKLLRRAGEIIEQKGTGLGIRPKSIKEIHNDIFSKKIKSRKKNGIN